MSLLRKELLDNFPKDYIKFADPVVEKICAENWGDGIGITYAQAAKVKTLGNKFQGNTEITTFDELQYFYGLTLINEKAFQNCTALQSFTLPETTTTISNNTFEGCTALIGQLSLENITTLGESALTMTGYSSVDIPNLVTVNNTTFARMANLTTANIPNVTSIPNYCFMECPNLETITIDKEKITLLGPQAFYNDRKLLMEIDFPNVTKMGSDVFYHCDSVYGSVNLPKISSVPLRFCPYSSITGIDDLGNANNTGEYAFGETKVNKIIFSEKITTVNKGLFQKCTNLEYVEFKTDDKLTIDAVFLMQCYNLKTLIIRTTNAVVNNTDSFMQSVPNTCNIYVPDDSVEQYKTAYGWSLRANQIKPLSEYVSE